MAFLYRIQRRYTLHYKGQKAFNRISKGGPNVRVRIRRRIVQVGIERPCIQVIVPIPANNRVGRSVYPYFEIKKEEPTFSAGSTLILLERGR